MQIEIVDLCDDVNLLAESDRALVCREILSCTFSEQTLQCTYVYELSERESFLKHHSIPYGLNRSLSTILRTLTGLTVAVSTVE